MDPLFLFILFAVIAIGSRFVAGSFDGDRVKRYIDEKGWELVDCSWAPFGPGWFGEKDSRIYEILYRDERGSLHRAHVKTSWFSGVYLTNDQVVEKGDDGEQQRVSHLQDENEQLKRRIMELEKSSRSSND